MKTSATVRRLYPSVAGRCIVAGRSGGRVATDALIDAQRLKLGVLQTTARLETNPDGGIIRPSVETHLVRDVSVEARFEQHGREFVFRSDEPTGRGGHAAGPTA